MIEIKPFCNDYYIIDHNGDGYPKYLQLNGQWSETGAAGGYFATKWLAEAALAAISMKPAETSPVKAAGGFLIGKGFGGWYVWNGGSQYLHTNGQLLLPEPIATVYHSSKASAEGALFNYLNPPSTSRFVQERELRLKDQIIEECRKCNAHLKLELKEALRDKEASNEAIRGLTDEIARSEAARTDLRNNLTTKTIKLLEINRILTKR